jgi:uncharacterized protein YndB with AHSA1/START domain
MHEDRFEELAGDVVVERSITLSADPESIWEHLTDGGMLGQWMEGEVTITPRPGGSITMRPEDGVPVWGTVEEVIPERRLQWSWHSDERLPTQVEIDLEPVGNGTKLTVRETLLPWRVSGLPPHCVELPQARASLSAAA